MSEENYYKDKEIGGMSVLDPANLAAMLLIKEGLIGVLDRTT